MEKFKRTWSALEKLVGAEDRIKQVATDLIEHFEDRTATIEGKGMIVAMSRQIAVNLYDAIIQIRPQWHNEDPADNLEINRTWNIANYQNNIPNPFIIDNSLIYRIYFYEEDISNLGDVTQDGTINIVDVILMINFILEFQTLSDDQLELADVNMDTIINIIDILIVMDIILNN